MFLLAWEFYVTASIKTNDYTSFCIARLIFYGAKHILSMYLYCSTQTHKFDVIAYRSILMGNGHGNMLLLKAPKIIAELPSSYKWWQIRCKLMSFLLCNGHNVWVTLALAYDRFCLPLAGKNLLTYILI